jgi:hypothetical protein
MIPRVEVRIRRISVVKCETTAKETVHETTIPSANWSEKTIRPLHEPTARLPDRPPACSDDDARKLTGSNGSGKYGFTKDTLWSTEGPPSERLTGF